MSNPGEEDTKEVEDALDPDWRRKLKIDDPIFCLDGSQKWCHGVVRGFDLEKNLILVHYHGWSDKWDEYIARDSDRLRPLPQDDNKGEISPDVRDIDDTPPNPDQPPSKSVMKPVECEAGSSDDETLTDLPDDYVDFQPQEEGTDYVEIVELPDDYVDFQPQEEESDNVEIDEEKLEIFDELAIKTITPKLLGMPRPDWISMDDLEGIRLVGSGHFGLTFAAEWTGKTVVIKAPKQKPSRDEMAELQTFLTLPRNLNVISVIGICQEFTFKSDMDFLCVGLVIPFMKYGDLKSFLEKHEISDKEAENIFLGMVRGVQHLHKNNIFHRDIALRNFLLDENGRVTVTDFGLSRRAVEGVEDDYIKADAVFPWRWCAPETISMQISNKETDIWMLGVAAWELFNKTHPFPDAKSPRDIVNGSVSLDLSKIPDSFRDIVTDCLQRDATKRPNTDEIIRRLLFTKPPVHKAVTSAPAAKTPVSTFLQKGIAIIKEAVEADNESDLETALQKYKRGLEHLVTGMKYERNPKTKRVLQQKILEYMERSEHIKNELDKQKKPAPAKKTDVDQAKPKGQGYIAPNVGASNDQGSEEEWSDILNWIDDAEEHDPPFLNEEEASMLMDKATEKNGTLLLFYRSLKNIGNEDIKLKRFAKRAKRMFG